MAKTVADILGQSKFDIDAPGGSVPNGSENGARGDEQRDDGSENAIVIPSVTTDGNQSEHSTVNPADARNDDNASDDGNRNRDRNGTRRRRSSNDANDNARTRKEKSESDLDLSEFLMVAHALLSRALESPEFEISPLEAKVLGGAIKRVLKHLPKLVKMTPMQEAISGLFAIALVMYVPRYMKYSARTGGKVVDAQNHRKDTPPTYTVNAAVGSV